MQKEGGRMKSSFPAPQMEEQDMRAPSIWAFVLGAVAAIVIVFLAFLWLLFPPPVEAATGYNIYWTTDKAEAVVFTSTWADRHDIMLVACDGVGRPKLDSLGQATFSRFRCEGDYDSSFYGDAFTCTLRFAVRPVTDTRFALVGGDNADCLPVQGYVVGN
jgi:hypothetical protein